MLISRPTIGFPLWRFVGICDHLLASVAPHQADRQTLPVVIAFRSGGPLIIPMKRGLTFSPPRYHRREPNPATLRKKKLTHARNNRVVEPQN